MRKALVWGSNQRKSKPRERRGYRIYTMKVRKKLEDLQNVWNNDYVLR